MRMTTLAGMGLPFLLLLFLVPMQAGGGHVLWVTPDEGVIAKAAMEEHDLPGEYNARRLGLVEVEAGPFAEARVGVGETITVELFGGEERKAVVDRVVRDVNGVVTTRARLADDPHGFLLVSASGGRTMARLESPLRGEVHHLYHHKGLGGHVLVEELAPEPLVCGTCGDPALCPLPSEAMPRLFLREDPLEHVVVDVMIVYTPRALVRAEQLLGGIGNVIAQAMEYANLALENSAAYSELRLADSSLWDHEEVSCAEDLEQVQISYDVRLRRDAVGADLVAVLGMLRDCGGMAGYNHAHSVNTVGHPTVFTHEVGHNFGAGHHKGQNQQPGPGLRSHAAGWRWVGNDGARHVSIMSYTSGNYYDDGLHHGYVPHFSNPDVAYEGVATGHPADGDNARAIREFKHSRADYRTPLPQPETFGDAHLLAGECGGYTGHNTDAGREPGEPGHAGNPGGASLWFEWTAPIAGGVEFTTARSTTHTVIAVYTGETLEALQAVAHDDGADTGHGSVRFDTTAGTTYRVAVDGRDGARGMIALGWCYPGSIVGWGAATQGQIDVPSPNAGFVALATGNSHSLAIRGEDGSVAAWGANTSGQLDIPGPNRDFVAVAGGFAHSLGLRADGSVVGWGSNGSGQLNVPEPNGEFIAIAAGSGHSLGLRSDGTIVAWGSNSSGQIDVPAPNTGFTAIDARSATSHGLRADGTVVSWGNNVFDHLTGMDPSAQYTAMATGFWHTHGLTPGGSIETWGADSFDQDVIPAPNEGFVAVAAGDFSGLALRGDGTAETWGFQGSEALPAPPPNRGFSAIAGGGNHALGLKEGTTVRRGWLRGRAEPPAAASAGARWRLAGTDEWWEAGALRGGIPAGEHEVEFDAPPGWQAPDNQAVVVGEGAVAVVAGVYTALPPALDVEPSRLAAGSGAGAVSLTIRNSGGGVLEWTAEITEGGDWLTIDPASGSLPAGGQTPITITHGENPATEEREGTLVITPSGAAPATVTIGQEELFRESWAVY